MSKRASESRQLHTTFFSKVCASSCAAKREGRTRCENRHCCPSGGRRSVDSPAACRFSLGSDQASHPRLWYLPTWISPVLRELRELSPTYPKIIWCAPAVYLTWSCPFKRRSPKLRRRLQLFDRNVLQQVFRGICCIGTSKTAIYKRSLVVEKIVWHYWTSTVQKFST